MRKALVTIVEGAFHEQCAEITMPTFEAYAERHGYELIRASMAEPPFDTTWSKAVRLREAIDTYDVALWVDCDAAISPSAPDAAQSVADSHVFQALPFLNYRHQGLQPDDLAEASMVQVLLSTGVWLVAQHPWAARFFQSLFEQSDLYHHRAHEAAAVWRLLGIDAGSAELLVRNNWLVYPTGTMYWNDRWNSRETDNDPHVFHATWQGARDQPELRLKLLETFVRDGAIPDELLSQR